MTLISEVHSIAAEQKNMGIDEAFGSSNPLMKNILTRVIGINDTVEVYVKKIVPEAGDMILICSDGLINYVDEKTIRLIYLILPPPLKAKSRGLLTRQIKGERRQYHSDLIEVLKENFFKKIIIDLDHEIIIGEHFICR
jgi:protein phosphatase